MLRQALSPEHVAVCRSGHGNTMFRHAELPEHASEHCSGAGSGVSASAANDVRTTASMHVSASDPVQLTSSVAVPLKSAPVMSISNPLHIC